VVGRSVYSQSLEKNLQNWPTSGARQFGLPVALKSIGLAVSKENTNMLWTIFVVLLVLWALGLVTAYTMGGLIHLLLVIALVVLVIQLIQGRRIV
jgi:Family of unknown function (DUF5670)